MAEPHIMVTNHLSVPANASAPMLAALLSEWAEAHEEDAWNLVITISAGIPGDGVSKSVRGTVAVGEVFPGRTLTEGIIEDSATSLAAVLESIYHLDAEWENASPLGVSDVLDSDQWRRSDVISRGDWPRITIVS